MKSNGRKALALGFSCYTNVTKIIFLGYGRFSLAAWAEGMVLFAPQKQVSDLLNSHMGGILCSPTAAGIDALQRSLFSV